MSIQQIYEAALKERGEKKACQLFEINRKVFGANKKGYVSIVVFSKLIKHCMEHSYGIRLKPLSELIKLDIERYGDNAFLMYQWRHDYDDLAELGYEKDTQWKTPKSNKDLIDLENSTNYILERKLYANIPFNIEWAKNGVDIEWVGSNECLVSCKFISQYDDGRALVEWGDSKRGLVVFVNLRHPFPTVKEVGL